MIVFADSSFANNADSSTQLGYIVLLTDDTDSANVLYYSSYKAKRIVRSVLGGETYAFEDGFDAGFMMRHDLQAMTGKHIPITMITDSESLFKVIVKSSVTTEKRLMVDIRATSEAYDRGDMSDVGWVRSAHNLADGLTKFASGQALVEILDTGRMTTEVEQWVLRKDFERGARDGLDGIDAIDKPDENESSTLSDEDKNGESEK